METVSLTQNHSRSALNVVWSITAWHSISALWNVKSVKSVKFKFYHGAWVYPLICREGESVKGILPSSQHFEYRSNYSHVTFGIRKLVEPEAVSQVSSFPGLCLEAGLPAILNCTTWYDKKIFALNSQHTSGLVTSHTCRNICDQDQNYWAAKNCAWSEALNWLLMKW